jgi:hypothetical protein
MDFSSGGNQGNIAFRHRIHGTDASGFNLSSGTNLSLFLKDNANVGIGTDNPQSTLDISGNQTLKGILSVSNGIFNNSILSINNTIIGANNLSIANGIIDASSLSVFGTTILQSSLSVGNNTFINGTISLSNTIIGSNNLSISNGIIDASSLSVFGTTTLSSTLSVSGNTTISGVLSAYNYLVHNWNSVNLSNPSGSGSIGTDASGVLIKIATLDTSGSAANGGSVYINGTIGSFGGNGSGIISLNISSRTTIYVNGSLFVNNYFTCQARNDFMIYQESDNTFSLYIRCFSSNKFDFIISGNGLGITLIPPNNITTTTPTGTLYKFGGNYSLLGQCLITYNNGNVGIGTTNPAYQLDVSGITRSSNGIYSKFLSNYTDSSVGYLTLTQGSGSVPGYMSFYQANGTRVGYIGWTNNSNYI